MRTTVETLEPYILEGRESIKAVVAHLMAVKEGDLGRMREALHEVRALRDASRRAEFAKVVHLCSNMERLIEATVEEGPEQIQETLEVLCDMCAHIVLYIDTVLLYADTFAMLIEFPRMRETLTRRLRHFSAEEVLSDPAAFAQVAAPKGSEIALVRPQAGEGDPEATLNELRALYEEGSKDANWVVDLSRLQDVPLWLVGTLMSYHVELRRQGRQIRLTGLPPGAAYGGTLRRLTDELGADRRCAPAGGNRYALRVRSR